EIEGVVQSLAQPRTGEFGAQQVEAPALPAGGQVIRNLLALHAAVADGRKIIAGGPGARGEFFAEQVALGLESLEADVAVAIILVANDVEIVLPDVDRQVRAPPVCHPLILGIATRFQAADPVWSGAQRSIERRLIELLRRVVGARDDRQPARP